MRISVIGRGCLGTVHTAALSSSENIVTAVDTVEAQLHQLSHDGVPLSEPDLLLTEWPESCGLSPVDAASVVSRTAGLAGRNALPAGTWRSVGWEYPETGRGASSGSVAGTASTSAVV